MEFMWKRRKGIHGDRRVMLLPGCLSPIYAVEVMRCIWWVQDDIIYYELLKPIKTHLILVFATYYEALFVVTGKVDGDVSLRWQTLIFASVHARLAYFKQDWSQRNMVGIDGDNTKTAGFR